MYVILPHKIKKIKRKIYRNNETRIPNNPVPFPLSPASLCPPPPPKAPRFFGVFVHSLPLVCSPGFSSRRNKPNNPLDFHCRPVFHFNFLTEVGPETQTCELTLFFNILLCCTRSSYFFPAHYRIF